MLASQGTEVPAEAAATCDFGAPVPAKLTPVDAGLAELTCIAPSSLNASSMRIALSVRLSELAATIPFYPFDTLWLPGLEGQRHIALSNRLLHMYTQSCFATHVPLWS